MFEEFLSVCDLPRPMSAQGDSVAQYMKDVHDLEEFVFCYLDECMPTERIYSNDDCLYMARQSSQSLAHKSSRHVRARYNFQQGLLNMVDALENTVTTTCPAVTMEQDSGVERVRHCKLWII